jgi:hypothetical protein
LSSDIEGFFRKIPRETLLKRVAAIIDDPLFNQLLADATKTELKNLCKMGKCADLFPTYSIGVAQGCCLSPLFGNILLHDFDNQMNDRGITCLRYIDDFLILGPKKEYIEKAFNNAQRLLQAHGLFAYSPFHNPEKAQSGEIKTGFEFLGCEILPGFIRPNKKSSKRLLDKVEEILTDSLRSMADPRRSISEKKSFVDTVMDVNNLIKGWGNQYSYCNDRQLFDNLDSEIDELLKRYAHGYSLKRNKVGSKDKRRLVGVQPLSDCKYDPLLAIR